ncbi:MAG: hypothetical protein ACQKBV_13770 [Puniceicoccales bacterium]
MTFLANIDTWMLRLVGVNPADVTGGVAFSFEGMNPGWAFLIGGLAAFVVLRMYWKGPGELSPARRIFLAVMRIVAVALVLLILTEPTIRLTEETVSRGALLVLSDSSASMDIQDARLRPEDRERAEIALGKSFDEAAPPSRRELVDAVAANRKINLWPRIAESVDVLAAPFGRSATALEPMPVADNGALTIEQAAEFFTALPMGKPATAIADSLEEALALTAGQPLTGVFLISDGGNNVGAPLMQAAEFVRRRGLPLYVYAPGVEAQRDVRVLSFAGPTMAYAREDAELNVRLRAIGADGESTTVSLMRGDEVIDSQEVNFTGDSEVELAFNYLPQAAGDVELSVVAQPLNGEATEENNAAKTQLQVADRRVKVLLIEQEPRWDFRYLLDTLKRDRRVEVSAVMLDGDKTLGTEAGSGFLRGMPTPEELLDYVIVVLGDVDPASLSREHMQALDTLARQTGGGLVFHAGPNNNPFKYRNTALADLLPVTVKDVGETGTRYDDPVALSLTRHGRFSPMLRLDQSPSDSEAIWRSFPGVRWTADTGPAKPAAEVLLVDPTPEKADAGAPQPVLARMSVGRGQVFFFGFDETWRWRSRVGEKHYLKIWGQVFLQLGLERLTGASDLVQLRTARSSYTLGESVLVSGRIFDDDFQPFEAPEVRGTVTIEPPGDSGGAITQEVVFQSRADRQGDYETEILAAMPGRYTVRTEEDPDATIVFSVDAANLEARDPGLNLSGLEQLVDGIGRVYREGDLAELPEAIESTLPTTRKTSLYNLAFSPFIFALLLLVPSIEWAMRRIFKLK